MENFNDKIDNEFYKNHLPWPVMGSLSKIKNEISLKNETIKNAVKFGYMDESTAEKEIAENEKLIEYKSENFKKQREAYSLENKRMEELFKTDLFIEHGMDKYSAEKQSAIYSFANNMCDGSFDGINCIVTDLKELLTVLNED